jgi:hypothetical protein
MFNYPFLFVAELDPSVFEAAPTAVTTPAATPTPGAGLFGQLFNAITTETEDLQIPAALNKLWKIAMNGSMYKTICFMGMFIAVFAVGFWCVKLYKTLEEGGLRPAVNDLVFPIILVIMLSNGGENMREMTLGTRNIMNNFNETLNRVIDADVNLKSATHVLRMADASLTLIDGLIGDCQTETDFEKYKNCMTIRGDGAKLSLKGLDGSWPSTNDKSNNGAQWQKEIDEWKSYTTKYANNRFNLDNLNNAREGFVAGKGLDIKNIKDFQSTAELRGTILSFRGAFVYIIEVMMLVTGLIGPIFLALSMFPVGLKPLITWGTSFLTLGFCKICFSLISGLSSLAMVLSGPDNIDMLVTAIVLGLLAPVLSFSIASGSGIQALSTISYSAQPFRIGTGITPYSPESLSRDNGGKKNSNSNSSVD